MVATHPHTRRTSGGSMGNTTGRSRRRSSLRRQSEKISSAIAPATATINPMTSNSPSKAHNGKRSKSVSTVSQRYTQQQQQQQQQQRIRRPSAPANIEAPRLSIADRFMSADASEFIPPLPQKSASPSVSTHTSIALSNSTSLDIPNPGSSSKLSVADRFMSSNNTSSPAISNLSISGIQQYRERSVSSVSDKNTRSSSLPTANIFSDPVPGRLTIANAFMKSSTSIPAPNDDSTRSRSTSIGDLDMSSSNENSKSKLIKPSQVNQPQQVHPLEETPKPSIFDDDNYLNLDLSIAPLSTSYSALNSDSNTRTARPWGSQDTLVHLNQQQEKKKPIYAQFIESEKNATVQSDNRSYTLSYSYLDSHDNDKRTITMSDDLSTKQGYDDYDDIDIGYDKHSKYNDPDRRWSYDEESDIRYHDREDNNSSPAISTTKLRKHLETERNDDSNNARGFWVGCCFVSCGQRPSKKSIEQHQKQRREKDLEGDMRPKNRGFGRRGWVFCTFLSLLLAILVTFFLWPRTPLMRIEGASLTSPAKITETRQGLMVGNVAFESEWLVNITVDNRQNHVPTRLVQIQVLAKDALTGLVIGKGLHNDDSNSEHIVLAPNTISTIQLPIHVDYQARDSTDTTFVDITKACSPQKMIPSPDGNSQASTRESLPLHFWITLHFFGLDWLGYKPTVIATPATGGFACPQS